MGQGFCIVGVEAQGPAYRSWRPMPARGHAWNPAWPHRRGDVLRFELAPPVLAAPHVEDRQSSGWVHRLGTISEADVVCALRRAEVATCVRDLFGCVPSVNRFGAGAGWVNPEQATRSICGCGYRSLRFAWKFNRWRVELALSSGETLHGLPIVDHEWNGFLEEASKALGSADQPQRMQRFLNFDVAQRLARHSAPFARLGLARPNQQQQCWIMLDSLFPLPQAEWLEGLRAAQPGAAKE